MQESHFLLPGAPAKSITPATIPLRIHLPDGSHLMSTHTATLDCDNIPEQARHAHIVPGLHHTSLISIKALCNAGCSVVYDSDECRVYLKGKLVWTGIREPSTGLWILPLTPCKEHLHALDLHRPHRPAETANSAYSMSSKESLIKFLH